MQQLIDFVLELDKLKAVYRKTKPLGQDRYENSAEHSWQIAMMAMTLAPLAAAPVDITRVVGMLLVHDIGEIDTGDTLVYADIDWAARKAAEQAGIDRIFGMLPEPQRSAFKDLWLEFDAEETRDAQFAHALDRAMPALLNLANNGQSWRENAVSYDTVVKRLREPVSRGCPQLWTYMEQKLSDARERGFFGS